MTWALVGVGSNVVPTRQIPMALLALRARWGLRACSSIYLTEAVGFTGPPFHNLVVALQGGDDAASLAADLKAMETALGRTEAEKGLANRHIDLDLLLFGEAVINTDGLTLPRPELTAHAFCLGPAAEIAGERVIPGATHSLAELWAARDEPLTVSVERTRVEAWLAAV